MIYPSSDGLLRCVRSPLKPTSDLFSLIDIICRITYGLLGKSLHSIYLTGSAAVGNYRPNKSDIDLFGFTTDSDPLIAVDNLYKAFYKKIDINKSHIKIDFRLFNIETLLCKNKKDFLGFFPLVYICLYGSDSGLLFPSYSWKDVHYYQPLLSILAKNISSNCTEKLQISPNYIYSRSWLMKCCLKASFESIMEQQGYLSRNALICYNNLVQAYPDYASFFQEIYALTDDTTQSLSQRDVEFLKKTVEFYLKFSTQPLPAGSR